MEEWLPVKGFFGVYEVSNYGRVKSLYREVPWVGKNGRCGVKYVNERILKPKIDKDGYEEFCLSNNGRTYKRGHRLVAEMFLYKEGCENLVVDHKDAVKDNNHVSNLQWLTSEQNTIKYYSEEYGKKKSLSSLSRGEWLHIGELYKKGMLYEDIFEKLEIDAVCPQTLWEGLSGRRLSSITGFKKGDYKKRPHPIQKLDEDDVMEVLHQRLGLNIPLKHIASKFGITESMISRICTGKRRPELLDKYLKGLK